MFRSIKVIAIIFLLSSCYSAKYTYQIKDDKNIAHKSLIDNNESIVVFSDDLYVDFINISEQDSSILLTKYGNTKNVNVVKIKAGRYFLPYGLFYQSRLTACLYQPIHNMGAIFLGAITFGIVVPMPSIGCIMKPKISKFSDQTNVLYFDVMPGEVIYIGDISYSYFFSYLYNEDNFNDIKEKLSKTMPSIANIMQKKLMKLEKIPEVCEDLQDEWSNDVNQNKPMKKIDLYQNYPACIEALNKLP